MLLVFWAHLKISLLKIHTIYNFLCFLYRDVIENICAFSICQIRCNTFKTHVFCKNKCTFLLRNFIVKKSVNFICSFTSNVANHYEVFYNETKLHKITSLINMQLQKRIFNMNEQQF